MVAIGCLLYAGVSAVGGRSMEDRPRVVVSQQRLDITLQTFVEENGRLPTREERHAILDALINQEVLYTYALELGMQENPAVQRRLAQIAEFVASNPHEMESQSQRAAEALDLGLQHDDLVVRRILVDNARRLIRAVVLLQEPSPKLIEEYLQANRALFERPAQVRITHVDLNGFKWPDTEERARQLLARIRSDGIAPEEAAALGDEPLVPSSLPLMTELALSRNFDRDFAASVMHQPPGEWFGPVASRYGHHLVYVRERREAYVPPLAKIHDQVKERLMEKLADEWLVLRLHELRLAYNIVAPPG